MPREIAFDDVEGFEPCRDERCTREGIHPKHTDDDLECPLCGSTALIKMPKKRARCAECSWRGGLRALTKTKANQIHA